MFEIFQYDFMVRALIAGVVVGAIAPLIGIFLVVRRYSLMSDTLAHVSLAGIAVSALLKTPPVITAVITTLLASLGIEKLRQSKKLFGEAVLALFLTSSLAFAVVVFSALRDLNGNLLSYLFGSITTVSPTDVWVICVLGVVVMALMLIFYRRLFAVAYDEDVAQAQGLPVRGLSVLLVMLAAITVSLAMRIVGVLLIGALMVIPVMAAMQFQLSFRGTTILGIAFSLLSVFFGLVLSFVLNLASGGTIVLVALVLFFVSLLWRSVLRR
jgi:zinc transport system permease protein